MYYHVETNTLICLIKRLGETHLEDSVYISCYQKLCHSATGIFATEHRHFSNNNLYFTSRTGCNIKSSASKWRYLHIIVSCCWLECQFLCFNALKASLPFNVVRILRSEPTIAFEIQAVILGVRRRVEHISPGALQQIFQSFHQFKIPPVVARTVSRNSGSVYRMALRPVY